MVVIVSIRQPLASPVSGLSRRQLTISGQQGYYPLCVCVFCYSRMARNIYAMFLYLFCILFYCRPGLRWAQVGLGWRAAPRPCAPGTGWYEHRECPQGRRLPVEALSKRSSRAGEPVGWRSAPRPCGPDADLTERLDCGQCLEVPSPWCHGAPHVGSQP